MIVLSFSTSQIVSCTQKLLNSHFSKMSYGTITDRQQFNAALERTEDGKSLLVVWCHAVWCGECKMLKPVIDAMTQTLGEDRNVLWYKMNIEEAEAVCDEYGISDVSAY